MNVEKRIAMERRIVRALIREMKKAGWALRSVFDGEESVRVSKEKEAMDVVFSVDESVIVFRKELGHGGVRRVVSVVLGNDGYDCLADHSVSNPEFEDDDFDAVMDGPVWNFIEREEERAMG